jgi:ketosteroid isomerase-like protein
MNSDLFRAKFPRNFGERLAGLVALFAFAAAAFGQAGDKRPKATVPLDIENARIVQLEHRWLSAQISGNVAALDRILASDFVRPDPADGKFITKAQMMAYLHAHPFPAPRGPEPRFSSLRVTIYGNVAIARGILAARGTHDVVLRKTLFTDVFVRRAGRWQAVSAQENRVRHP